MNYNEFAEKIKSKYPQYNNVDNRLLAEKSVKKYPQYSSNVSFDDETELPKSSNLLTGGISKNVSTPYMDIANNSNLTKEQKSAQINELYNNEIQEAELEKQENIKANAKSKLAKREQEMQEHPILQTFNKFLNPIYDAETNLLKERAEYGTKAPLDVKITNTLKRGVMGGLTTLVDAAMLIPGGREIRAAQIAKATQGVNTANKISNIAKASGYGALGFGSQEFADSAEDLLNNNAANKDVVNRTLKGTVTGALVGGLGYGTYGALTKPVENIVKKTAENKVYNILANAQKKGQVATKEQVDNLIKNEINKINDNILTGSLVKSAKTIPATAVDTASMAVADYGLNSLQGKQELSLPEQLKSYAPLIAFGGLPAVSHIAGKSAKKVLESNVVKDFVNKNNNISSLTGEISNALGVNTNYENAQKFQELDKKVQGYNMPAQKHYTSDEINFSENINNLSDKEKRIFLQYLTKGLNVDKSLKKTLSKTKNEVKEINNKVQEDNNLEKQIIENVFGEEVPNVPKEYAHIMRRISKDMEKKRIKRGLITPEQAINRKKQILNGQKGEAAYVPMYSENTPIEETIDITRNYNSGRESKVGLYGKAVKKGVKGTMSAEKAVENLYTASIKTNFIDEIADYVEKNFAKPIKNGHVEKGYVAVNSSLLWNGLASKASPEWYDLISKGEEAIRKAYKNEKQADFFVELHNRTKEKDFQIPEQVFKKLLSGEGETAKEAFERYGLSGYSASKHIGALSDAFTDQFKRNVLGTASFWVNNRLGNHLMLAANSENPAKYILDLYQAGKIKNKDMPQELLENSILEAVKNSTKRKTYSGYNSFDNIVNLFGGHLLDTNKLQKIIKLNKKFYIENKDFNPGKSALVKTANAVIGFPNKVYNKIANGLLEFNSKFEDYERKIALVQQPDKNKKELLKQTGQQMITMKEALKHLDKHPEMRATIISQVENVLGDYNNFNYFEKNVLKRVIPFYSWFRTITRNTLHLAKNNPARFALIQYELNKLKNEDEDLKDYQKGSFRLPVKDKRSNKQLLINKTRQIPWETLHEMTNEDDIKNSVNPLIKVPLEAIRGKKFFGSGEITNKRYVSKYSGKTSDGKNRYQYYDTKTGDYIDSLPASTRLGFTAKELGKNFVPLLSNRLIGGESLLQGLANYNKNGKFIEPDKLYDADFGGFSHGNVSAKTYKPKKGYKSIKRYAASNTSEETKLLNRLGLTLQPKQELSQEDKTKLTRLAKKYKERLNKRK